MEICRQEQRSNTNKILKKVNQILEADLYFYSFTDTGLST